METVKIIVKMDKAKALSLVNNPKFVGKDVDVLPNDGGLIVGVSQGVMPLSHTELLELISMV